MHSYKTSSVCAKEITFEIKDGKLFNINFVGGCPGNLIGISKLVEGLDAKEAVKKLKGVDCRDKGTSCPDQLAMAIEEVLN